MKHQRPGFIILTLLALVASLEAAEKTPSWPQWRGPNRDGLSTETGLLENWQVRQPKLLWKATGLGRGFSSVAIADGKIFTIGQVGKRTMLAARRLEDGSEVWSAHLGKGRPNGTPTVDGDRVYGIGRNGNLLCAKTSDGTVLWRKHFGNDFGGRMMSGWGYSESPLVDGDKLVCTPGAPDGIIVALNKKTGELIWKSDPPRELGRAGKDGAGYSSIIISEAAGVRQYVQLTGRGIVSVAADDGRFLWVYNRVANSTANIPTPIVKDNYVFCSSGYGTGAALLEIVKDDNQVQAKEVYFLKAKTLQNHHGGMVLVGDYIYCGHGHNQGFPVCLEMKSGKVLWGPERGPGRGSAAVVFADGHLYFRYENGVMALVEATPKKFVLKGTFEIASRLDKSWPHPVVAGGRLYLRDQDVLLCYKVDQ